jgi:hypothetical protein
MELVPTQTDKELSPCLSDLSQSDSLPVLLHDGPEREIPRPVDYDEQKEKYSEKEKRHTVKNAVIISASCLVLFASQTVCGKMHDKKIAGTIYSFPYPCTLYQDTGYQGYRPDGVNIVQPVKKSRRKELSEEDKIINREVSPVRVRVRAGHAIGGIRFMRIVKEECRLRANSFVERIFAICAALHNFRIKVNPWEYEI